MDQPKKPLPTKNTPLRAKTKLKEKPIVEVQNQPEQIPVTQEKKPSIANEQTKPIPTQVKEKQPPLPEQKKPITAPKGKTPVSAANRKKPTIVAVPKRSLSPRNQSSKITASDNSTNATELDPTPDAPNPTVPIVIVIVFVVLMVVAVIVFMLRHVKRRKEQQESVSPPTSVYKLSPNNNGYTQSLKSVATSSFYGQDSAFGHSTTSFKTTSLAPMMEGSTSSLALADDAASSVSTPTTATASNCASPWMYPQSMTGYDSGQGSPMLRPNTTGRTWRSFDPITAYPIHLPGFMGTPLSDRSSEENHRSGYSSNVAVSESAEYPHRPTAPDESHESDSDTDNSLPELPFLHGIKLPAAPPSSLHQPAAETKISVVSDKNAHRRSASLGQLNFEQRPSPRIYPTEKEEDSLRRSSSDASFVSLPHMSVFPEPPEEAVTLSSSLSHSVLKPSFSPHDADARKFAERPLPLPPSKSPEPGHEEDIEDISEPRSAKDDRDDEECTPRQPTPPAVPGERPSIDRSAWHQPQRQKSRPPPIVTAFDPSDSTTTPITSPPLSLDKPLPVPPPSSTLPERSMTPRTTPQFTIGKGAGPLYYSIPAPSSSTQDTRTSSDGSSSKQASSSMGDTTVSSRPRPFVGNHDSFSRMSLEDRFRMRATFLRET